MTVTDVLLSPLLAAEPSRPRITYYDDAHGERVELSTATVANWAAKTANLLRDELDVEPGCRVACLLPAHWQTAAVLLGVWWCGAALVEVPQAEVLLVDGGHVDRIDDRPAAALSLDFLGRGLPGLPAGVVDFATEVRTQPDAFTPDHAVTAATPAIGAASVHDVVARSRDRAGLLGLTGSDRVLSTREWSGPADLYDGLLAVLAAGASLVQCRNPDRDALPGRMAAEKITRVLPAR